MQRTTAQRHDSGDTTDSAACCRRPSLRKASPERPYSSTTETLRRRCGGGRHESADTPLVCAHPGERFTNAPPAHSALLEVNELDGKRDGEAQQEDEANEDGDRGPAHVALVAKRDVNVLCDRAVSRLALHVVIDEVARHVRLQARATRSPVAAFVHEFVCGDQALTGRKTSYKPCLKVRCALIIDTTLMNTPCIRAHLIAELVGADSVDAPGRRREVVEPLPPVRHARPRQQEAREAEPHAEDGRAHRDAHLHGTRANREQGGCVATEPRQTSVQSELIRKLLRLCDQQQTGARHCLTCRLGLA